MTALPDLGQRGRQLIVTRSLRHARLEWVSQG